MYLFFCREKTLATIYREVKSLFFCQMQITILFRYSPHPLRSLILHIHSALFGHSPHHSTHSYTVLDNGEKMHMKQSPYQLHPQQFLSSSSSFYIMLHFKRDICEYYGVFQTSLHMKRKLTLRNMNGCLYCCYQKSPYQLCPHILVFMFKNYIPHRQTDRHTYTHTHTHIHTYTHTHTICILLG